MSTTIAAPQVDVSRDPEWRSWVAEIEHDTAKGPRKVAVYIQDNGRVLVRLGRPGKDNFTDEDGIEHLYTDQLEVHW